MKEDKGSYQHLFASHTPDCSSGFPLWSGRMVETLPRRALQALKGCIELHWAPSYLLLSEVNIVLIIRTRWICVNVQLRPIRNFMKPVWRTIVLLSPFFGPRVWSYNLFNHDIVTRTDHRRGPQRQGIPGFVSHQLQEAHHPVSCL